MNQYTQFRDGRLENFMREEGEGGGGGQSTTKKLCKGKFNETNLMHRLRYPKKYSSAGLKKTIP